VGEESEPGYVLKLRWAKHHTKLLHDEIDGHLDTYTVRSKLYQGDSIVVVTLVVPGERHPWELILGDAIYNFRSSLDQLAFALVPPESMTREIETTSAFPISRSDDHFARISHRVKGVPEQARTVIEGLQPHKRQADYRDDPLWILEELSNIDKHRTLHTTILGIEGAALQVTEVRDLVIAETIEFTFPDGLVNGAELARIPVVQTGPHPYVNVEMDAEFAVTFDERATVAPDEHVLGVLVAIAEDIETVVFPSLERFV
jgi:hypothetical protein